MKRIHVTRKFAVVVLLSLCAWSCYDDPFSEVQGPGARPGQLTVEEAHEMFVDYASRAVLSRSEEDGGASIPLNPGILTPDWERATFSTTSCNSYVNVPVQTTNGFQVRSPYNKDWVEVIQKLVAVQDDGSRRRNLYVLSIIPEGDSETTSPSVLARDCNGGDMPAGFSGLIVYTKPRGGIPVYAGSYREGRLVKEVFLFDKSNTFEENLESLNGMLEGYRLQPLVYMSSRSYSEGGDSQGGGGGDEWVYHTTGDPFQQYGYTCWFATDGKGNWYIVADTNKDGQPDTILDDGTDYRPGGEGGDEGGSSTGGGDVNPGGGITGGGGTGDGDDDTGDGEGGANIPKEMAEIIDDIEDAIDISDSVLNNMEIVMGTPTTSNNAAELNSVGAANLEDVLYGDSPLQMVLRDMPVNDYSRLVLAHEFYHAYLFGLSRDAGSARALGVSNPELQSLLNVYDVNNAHHNYIGEHIDEYEDYLRDVYPGKSEDFYRYGRWGGGVYNSPAFQRLPESEQQAIYDYLLQTESEL